MNLRKFIITISVFTALFTAAAISTFADGCCTECGSEDIYAYADGEVLRVHCNDCDEDLPYYIEITTDHVCDAEDFEVDASEWEEAGMPEYVVIYEDENYDIYEYLPEEPGTYYVSLISLIDYEDDMLYEEGCQTESVEVTVGHSWSYTAEDYALKATCGFCDEKASVCLDLESIYEANKYPEKDLPFTPVLEENWSCHSDIMSYTARYDGYEYIDKNNTRQYVTGEIKPTNSGIYSVHLAIVYYDGSAKGKELYSTKEKSFYIAKIEHYSSMSHYYTDDQIATFTKPEVTGGVYQVGTAEELLWCLYNYESVDNIKISITNDIIVNPISITDEGKVYIGSNYMYYWEGFGTVDKPFNGTIEGNGHTIYGIYVPTYSYISPKHRLVTGATAGFIRIGGNVTINDLTIENSYFDCRWNGAFIAVSTGSVTLKDCNSVNNHFDGRFVGGFIGLAGHSASGQTFSITGCKNYSYIYGVEEGGGIVGYCDPDNPLYSGTISDCRNYGTVKSLDLQSGGIIGTVTLRDDCKFTIDKCVNLGNIENAKYAGGIVARFNTTDNTSSLQYLYINNCCSTGKVHQYYSTHGGILGGVTDENKGTAVFNNCTYYNTDKGTSVFVPVNDGAPAPGMPRTKNTSFTIKLLTADQINNDYVCNTYGHDKERHYSSIVVAGCETYGSSQLICHLCKTVLDTKQVKPHGHLYEWNQTGYNCSFCGQSDPSMAGSLFSSSINIVLLIAVPSALLIVGGAYIIYKKRKKTKTKNDLGESYEKTII